MTDDKKTLLEVLAELGDAFQQSMNDYSNEVDVWWSQLSKEDQERAFFAVVKRLVQGELRDRGSYRYVLYDVFGFDASYYALGMECGYMELHNSIYTREEMRELRDRELAAAGIEVKTNKLEKKDE
jgi:hypothetical protein